MECGKKIKGKSFVEDILASPLKLQYNCIDLPVKIWYLVRHIDRGHLGPLIYKTEKTIKLINMILHYQLQ